MITKDGRPAAVIVPLEEAEDLVLANAEGFLTLRQGARDAYWRARSKPLDEIA